MSITKRKEMAQLNISDTLNANNVFLGERFERKGNRFVRKIKILLFSQNLYYSLRLRFSVKKPVVS